MNIDITEYIPYGRKNAVSRHELQRRTGLPDRTVRALIEDARRKGAHILSSSADKGYWKSNNVGEIKEFLRESDGRIRKTAQTVEALRRRGRCAGKSTFSTFAETKDAERTDYILGGAEFGGTKDVQPKGY